MIFADVNRIVIPEGEVTVIARGADILWKKPRLPVEYQEVAYLKSDGGQYIDSEVIASTSIITEVKCQSFAGNKCIVGMGTTASQRYQIYANTDLTYSVLCAGTASNMGGVPTAELATIKLDPVAQKASINDVVYDLPFTGAVQNRTLWLFARNQTSNVKNYYSTTNMWYCKMWDIDTPIRDYVPCYRKADKKPGMYDLVTKRFFINQGTGEFSYRL